MSVSGSNFLNICSSCVLFRIVLSIGSGDGDRKLGDDGDNDVFAASPASERNQFALTVSLYVVVLDSVPSTQCLGYSHGYFAEGFFMNTDFS